MLPNIGLVLVKGLLFPTRENSFYCTMRRWPEVRRVLIIPWIVLPHYVGGCGGSPAPHARHTASELSVEAVAALPSPQADLLGSKAFLSGAVVYSVECNRHLSPTS